MVFQSRGQSIGAYAGRYCLLASVILALFSGALSRSQETRLQKHDAGERELKVSESLITAL